MAQLKIYFSKIGLHVFGICVLSAMFMSCEKSSSSSTTYLGDFARASDFEGVARTEAVSFVIGDKAYVGLGYQTGDERLKDMWEFDASSGTWKQKADLPGAARSSAVAFAVSDKGYVGTGYDGANMLKDFYEYNAATNTWTQKADFGGSARYGAVGFSVSGKGFIATGFDNNHLKHTQNYKAGK